MATMAAYPGTEDYRMAGAMPAVEAEWQGSSGAECRVRAFPNEDILFWHKPAIDNTRVVRKEDPQMLESCWKLFSVFSMVVVVAVGLLLPSAYSLIGGMHLEQLRQRNVSLQQENRRLRLEESRLTSPERIERLAHDYGFDSPKPGSTLQLNGQPGEAVAKLGTLR